MDGVEIHSMAEFEETFGPSPMVWINERVGFVLRAQAEHVEARLLAGENRVEVPYIPGDPQGRTIVYEVPRWRERPFRRLRIEWMRWRRR